MYSINTTYNPEIIDYVIVTSKQTNSEDYKIERIPQGNIDLRFNTIMNELKIPSLGKHDAYNDAVMTSMIFIKLKNLPKVKIN